MSPLSNTNARPRLQSGVQLTDSDVENVLSQHVPNADVIFADPPFNQGLSQAFCTWIQGQLQPDSLLILEAERDTTLDFTGFEVLKFLHAGADSMYVLAQDGP